MGGGCDVYAARVARRVSWWCVLRCGPDTNTVAGSDIQYADETTSGGHGALAAV